jgi:hypothetical protein
MDKVLFPHQLSEPLATEHKAENITGYPSKCPSPIYKLLRILRGCQPRLQSTDEKFWWFPPLKSWSPKIVTGQFLGTMGTTAIGISSGPPPLPPFAYRVK